MTVFNIKCETFLRFTNICSYFAETTTEETKLLINNILIENKNGHSFIAATNQKIFAVEYLGTTDQPDGLCFVKLDEKLIKQCEFEQNFDFSMQITIDDSTATSTIISQSGYMAQDVVNWHVYSPLQDWRDFFVPPPKKSEGFMFINLHYLETLIKCSPSAEITMPETFNSSEPVILNDRFNENWMGAFIPKLPIEKGLLKAAEVKEWVKL